MTSLQCVSASVIVILHQLKPYGMEFQEGLRILSHKPKWGFGIISATEAFTLGSKWNIPSTSSSSDVPSKPQSKPPPKEFLCPLSGFLMADPVIVTSGHSFERTCVQACKNLGFTPAMSDGSTPDFSTLIPNLALKSAIINWYKICSIDIPKPPDSNCTEKLIRAIMATQNGNRNHGEPHEAEVSEKELIQDVKETPPVNMNHAATEVTRCSNHLHTSSEESVAFSASTPSMQLCTRPSSYSSLSSSEIEIMASASPEEEILLYLKSPRVFEVEQAVISLRNLTRNREKARVPFCTPKLLSALPSLITSRYTSIQVNAVAALVNLSLEKVNKVKIVRSGLVPPLIDVLKGGYPESQEHASAALFSLALDDNNKAAIGALGALPPLIHLLRSESERTRHDSVLALYHLSLLQSNRMKLIKLGSVPLLMDMVKSGNMTGRILLILRNLASDGDGRAALLKAGTVEYLISLLGGNDSIPGLTQESCVTLLYALSNFGLRFKLLARSAGAVETLRKIEKKGSERGREKLRMILECLETMRVEEEGQEEMDWKEILVSSSTSREDG